MKSHQKYFTLRDAQGRMAPRFVMVANLAADDGGAAIVAGNERVLRARLADARFFWDQDRGRSLASRLPKLKEIIFHATLGTVAEKGERMAELAAVLAQRIAGADPDLCTRAARLAKADLVTNMVGEFPELQGVMGRYYALNDGEPAELAEAVGAHYSPAGPSDACPSAPAAMVVALADKIDTLVCFWAIDEKPTGSKDPYALRRAALGVIRIILENGLRLPMLEVFDAAHRILPRTKLDGGVAHANLDDLLAFFADRLKAHLRAEGVPNDHVAAVFALGDEDDLVRLMARVRALGAFLAGDDGANLLTAYRRAANILRIEEKKDSLSYDGRPDAAMLVDLTEARLHGALQDLRGGLAPLLADERFADAMALLAGLRDPVDEFFDRVTVNVDDQLVRANRLRLLAEIRDAMNAVADFSRIGAGATGATGAAPKR